MAASGIEFLTCLHFRSSKTDISLFILRPKSTATYRVVYVDDIFITGSFEEVISDVVQQLHVQFSLKNLGRLEYLLGIEVKKIKGGSFLSQMKYIMELFHKTNIHEAHVVKTPMTVSRKLSKVGGCLIQDVQGYRSVVGAVQYICHTLVSVLTRLLNICTSLVMYI